MGHFGEYIVIVVNSFLLFMVYIIGVGLTAIVAMVCRKKFLDTKLGGKTYWTDLNLKKKDEETYYRQF